MYHCGILVIVLLLGGCQDSPQPTLSASLLTRTVATVYKIKSAPNEPSAACMRTPSENASVITRLQPGELVELVSLDEGMLERDNGYWLRVYPPLSHRPSCFINVHHLIPYA